MPRPVRDDLLALASRMREAAKAIGTQEAAGRAIGVSLPQMQRYVSARSEPPMKVAAALATAAGFTVEWMLTGKGPKLFSEQMAMAREQSVEQDRADREHRVTSGDLRSVVLERIAFACEVAGVEFSPSDADSIQLVDDTVGAISVHPATMRAALTEAVLEGQMLALGYARMVSLRKVRISLLTRRPL